MNIKNKNSKKNMNFKMPKKHFKLRVKTQKYIKKLTRTYMFKM